MADSDNTLLDQAIAGILTKTSLFVDDEQLSKLRSVVETYRDM